MKFQIYSLRELPTSVRGLKFSDPYKEVPSIFNDLQVVFYRDERGGAQGVLINNEITKEYINNSNWLAYKSSAEAIEKNGLFIVGMKFIHVANQSLPQKYGILNVFEKKSEKSSNYQIAQRRFGNF